MSGTEDTTKTFYTGDDVTMVLKRNKQTGHFTALAGGSGVVADIPTDHFVEVRMKHGRLEATKRPFPILPTYEQVRDLVIEGQSFETFDEQTVAIMKLYGDGNPKPTPAEVDEYTGV